jgi:hypothetical protein
MQLVRQIVASGVFEPIEQDASALAAVVRWYSFIDNLAPQRGKT